MSQYPHKTHFVHAACLPGYVSIHRYTRPMSISLNDSRAIAWVDEPLLAQAHKRLPPADLYYPVDEDASRQGRWQQQAEEALEECGYAYFLPASGDDMDGDDVGDDVDAVDNNNRRSGATQAQQSGQEETASPSFTNPSLTGGEKRPRAGQQRRPATSTSKAASRRAALKSRRKAAAAEVAERGILEQQSHGLQLEMKRATRAASTTFKEGDRVESRWRRPTRLDKPRLDPNCWHTGLVVQSHKDGARVDVVFEDGDGERLSGIPVKYVRLAPLALSLRQPVVGSGVSDGDMAVAGSKGRDSSSCTPTALPIESLCLASRRELAHIASANTSLRRTWEDPVPIGQELARLRMLGEEKMRARPEWQGSFPLLDFQAAKRLSLDAGRAGTGAQKATAAAAGARDRRRERRQAQEEPSRGITRARPRKSATASLLARPRTVTVKAGREDDGYRQAQPDSTRALSGDNESATINHSRGRFSTTSPLSPLPSSPALAESQARLVTAAMAYDRCVADARDCLDRGAAAFRAARTYSEQQRAFEESTVTLGPVQPARAGYTDWRGTLVVGLQNATLDVVEAMDSWAAEWAAARHRETGDGQHGGLDREGGGENSEGETEVGKDGVVAAAPVAAPPFMWEGSPLVSTIIGHSARLLAGAPELKEWYGPGFPIERNPFFLAYPIDDRPVTPRNALVRAWVDGEVRTRRADKVQGCRPYVVCCSRRKARRECRRHADDRCRPYRLNEGTQGGNLRRGKKIVDAFFVYRTTCWWCSS